MTKLVKRLVGVVMGVAAVCGLIVCAPLALVLMPASRMGIARLHGARV